MSMMEASDEAYGSSDDYDPDSEYDEEYDDYDESEEEDDDSAVESEDDGTNEAVVEYDAPLSPSFVQTIGSTVGVMYLSKKIDLFDPKVVKVIR